jgi:hypothetical protein
LQATVISTLAVNYLDGLSISNDDSRKHFHDLWSLLHKPMYCTSGLKQGKEKILLTFLKNGIEIGIKTPN